uniref:Venom CUB domain protein 2 n=1 Tax=Ectomocoris sp. TaxID=3104572 RepID=A0AB38ZEA9_9HEMI
MKAVYLSLAFIAFVAGDDPVIKKDSVELATTEEFAVESLNYPEDAPANLQQEWILKAPKDHAVRLECHDIRLFEDKPCGAWALVITDGDKKEELCTSIFDFTKTSETNVLVLSLRIGGDSRGFVACKAKAVKK